VRVLRPDLAPRLITPLSRKLQLMEATGISAALVLPFTRDFSVTTARDFARLLRERLHAIEVHEGSNFHFGHKAEGDVERLSELGREFGFQVKIYPEMQSHGDIVSSSRVRELLREGRVSRARALLGRAFSVTSTPGRGRGYGQKYTVPTINLSQYEELVPSEGVYVTRTRVGAESFDSVTNVGHRPTFGEDSFAIETHLLGFHPISLTFETELEISFLRRLRVEIKFSSVELLRAQISRDIRKAERYFRLAQHLNPAATIPPE